MTNVLPLEAQATLWRMQRARFVIALCIMLSAAALVALLGLIPSYIAVNAAVVEPESNTEVTTAATDIKTLKRAQALATFTAGMLAPTTTPLQAIEAALAAKPAQVTIERIRYAGGTNRQVQIAGTAGREQLAGYRTALQSVPLFSSVSIPVGSLVSAQEGSYSLTLIIQK